MTFFIKRYTLSNISSGEIKTELKGQVMIKKFLGGLVMGAVTLAAQVPDKPMFKILDKAHEISPQENVLLSPYSLLQCFGMVACGAGDKSGMELRRVLGLDELTAKELQLADESLKKSKNAEFVSCNSIIFKKDLVFQPDFVNKTVNLYKGKLYQVDFSRKAECVNMLNSMVAKESRNMFQKVFREEHFAGDPMMVLMNVLYFKAMWWRKFDTFSTRNQLFTLADGAKYKVPMMADETRVPYFDNGKIHGIILDYQERRFGMMFLMTTDPKLPLSTVTGYLGEKGIAEITAKASEEYKTRIRLPKLKLESDCDLVELLRKAGISELFNSQGGDLIHIVKNIDDPLYIDQARQLIKLDLNERGTEMAAVTYAFAKVGSGRPMPEKKNTFYADRPFVMVLFDRETNAILLAGVINKPVEI